MPVGMLTRYQRRPQTSLSHKAASTFPFPHVGWQHTGDFHWNMTSYQNYADEGFTSNPIIHAAIMYKVNAITQALLTAYTGDPESPKRLPHTHPASAFAMRPNDFQSGMEFMQLAIVYFNLSGNCFIYLERASKTAPVTAMYTLRPDRIEILVDKAGKFAGYKYRPEGYTAGDGGVPILPEYMLHIKRPNPLDPLEGQGYGANPLAAVARAGDVDNAFSKFLYQFFRTGGMGLGVLSFEGLLDPATIGRIRSEWTEVYGGADNWPKPIVMDRSGKYQNMSGTLDTLAADKIDARNEGRILAVIGVPGMLLGLQQAMQRATFSNVKEATTAFWQNTMIPELQLFEVEFLNHLSQNGAFYKFDTSKVPALQRDVAALVAAYAALWQTGVPRAIAAQVVGLEIMPHEGDDISYLPAASKPAIMDADYWENLPALPAGGKPLALPANAGNDSEDEDEPAGGGRSRDGDGDGELDEGKKKGEPNPVTKADNETAPDESKALARWQQQEDIATRHEDAYEQAGKRAFGRQQAEILALLTETKKKALQNKASIVWDAFLQPVSDYLSAGGVDDWRSQFAPVIRALVTDAGQAWAAELGMQFDVVNVFALTWFDRYTLTFAQAVNGTTKQAIADMLQQAQLEGWTVDQMQTRLGLLFRQWMTGDVSKEDFEWFKDRLPEHRLRNLVRTETVRSYNAGSTELMKEWGVQQKEWYVTFDERTCPFCYKMHGKKLFISENFAQLGEKIRVVDDNGKEQSMTVGFDNVGYPPLHPQCRCVILAVV